MSSPAVRPVAMSIIEQYVRGKYGDDRCEDAIVCTRDYIAIADGASPKTRDLFNGRTSAWVIAHEIMGCIERIDDPGLSGGELIRHINAHLCEKTIPSWGLPNGGRAAGSAALAVYCAAKKEITRIADIQCLLNGKRHDAGFDLDRLMSDMRSAAIELAFLEGKTEAAASDAGRDAIQPILNGQHMFRNNSSSPWGFGAVDGSDDVLRFMTTIPVNDGDEIVLATDGYPEICRTLQESEEELARLCREDPLMYRLHKSTKGVGPGMGSFDDRAYVRFIA